MSPLAHTGGVDLARAVYQATRIAVRVFIGTLRMIWQICDLPARLLIPPRYPGLRALLTGVVFIAVIVAVDLVLTGSPAPWTGGP